ncbi:MAG: ADP-ribosylglycohydrolase family protein [Chloroflexi bacterium]|nr:ADP-ribosylglycohydrolase family protein [Chloroflexota bacterium]
MEIPLRDRFAGCLLGVAVGDALGAPVEFMTREAIHQHYGRVEGMQGGGWLELKPGQVTDDTEMLLCLAESLVAKGAFDPADVARRLVVWYRQGPRDIGITTEAALKQLAAGVPWADAGRAAHRALKGRSAGNGGMTRGIPLALLDYRDAGRLVEDSLAACRITHWDDGAAYASVAVNVAIAGVLVGHTLRQALEESVRVVGPHHEQVARAIDAALDGPYTRPEVSGLAVDTLQAAARCVYQSRSFEDALVTAVNLGGDTDSVGAVCGALAGAYYGVGAVPSQWLQPLEHRERLEHLAGRLFALSGAAGER